MKICVQGLWHLGAVTAACLASRGHEVVGLDFDTRTVDKLKAGQAPILEAGLDELLNEGLSKGNLDFTTSIKEAIKGIEILWVTYDTPVDENDNADVSYVREQIKRILPELPKKTVILISSQMPVGSVKELELFASSRCSKLDLRFAYSPENLRLGKAIEVFLNPDRIVVGTRSEKDKERLRCLLKPVTEHIEWMSVESAEMTKHAINAFLATSITFANEIASICELVGADAKEVEKGLKSENRIGPNAYLSPGGAFAGGTLARDITFLTNAGSDKSLSTPLLSSVRVSNEEHKKWVKRRLKKLFPDLTKIRIAIWGLTYKPGTNTLRGSAAIELCTWLLDQGVEVAVHDPAAEILPVGLKEKLTRHDDPIQTLFGAHALVVTTEWPQYKELDSEEIFRAAPQLVVIDTNRFLSNIAKDNRFKHVAVGSPAPVIESNP